MLSGKKGPPAPIDGIGIQEDDSDEEESVSTSSDSSSDSSFGRLTLLERRRRNMARNDELLLSLDLHTRSFEKKEPTKKITKGKKWIVPPKVVLPRKAKVAANDGVTVVVPRKAKVPTKEGCTTAGDLSESSENSVDTDVEKLATGDTATVDTATVVTETGLLPRKKKVRTATVTTAVVIDAIPTVERMNVVHVPTKKKKRKSRGIQRELVNTCMPKNSRDKVEISKLTYDPEKGLNEETISGLMGLEGMRLSEGKREQMKNWYITLKDVAGYECRRRIINEVLENAGKFGYGWLVIEDIQDAWAAALNHDERMVEGQKILKCLSEGYFAERPDALQSNWKYVMETDVMEHLGLAYLPGEGGMKEDGCISKQSSRSRADIVKRIGRKGKSIHKYIVSRKAPKIMEKTKDYRYKKKQKNDTSGGDNKEGECTFLSSYVRKTDTKTKPRQQNKVSMKKGDPKIVWASVGKENSQVTEGDTWHVTDDGWYINGRKVRMKEVYVMVMDRG